MLGQEVSVPAVAAMDVVVMTAVVMGGRERGEALGGCPAVSCTAAWSVAQLIFGSSTEILKPRIQGIPQLDGFHL